jgi:hypothetical protein
MNKMTGDALQFHFNDYRNYLCISQIISTGWLLGTKNGDLLFFFVALRILIILEDEVTGHLTRKVTKGA